MRKAVPERVREVAKRSGFDELNDKLDRVIDAMSTKDDIADLRAEMTTKRELRDLDERFTKKLQELLIMMEGLMKPISELKMEYAGMMMQLSRHEEWIKLLAKKQGIAL